MYLGYDRKRFRRKGGSVVKGILLEPAATNLLPDTVNLVTGWSATGITRTSGQALRSSTYGVKIDMAAGGGAQLNFNSAAVLPAIAMCASAYWKKGTGAGAGRLVWRNQASSVTYGDCYWTEASPGVLTLTTVTGTAGYLSLGNGWYRIWSTSSAVVPANGVDWFIVDSSAAGTYTYWGLPQFEKGFYPTSPIPNTAAGSVTRAADGLIGTFGGSNLIQGAQGAFLVRLTTLMVGDVTVDQHMGKIIMSGGVTIFLSQRSAGSVGHRGIYGTQSLSQAGTPLSTYYNRKSVYGVRGNAAGVSMHAAGATIATTAVAAETPGSSIDTFNFAQQGGNDIAPMILWEAATYLTDPGTAAINAADAGALPAPDQPNGIRKWVFTPTFPLDGTTGWGGFTRPSTALNEDFLVVASGSARYGVGAF